MALSHYAPVAGLDVELILYGQQARQGNYLDILNSRANLTLLPQWEPEEIEAVRRRIIHRHSKRGRQFFSVPTGATNSLTTLAGVDLAIEIVDQERSLGATFQYVVVATGTGGTQVGLELGRRVLDAGWSLIGIAIANDEAFFRDVASHLYASQELADLAGACGTIELRTYLGAQGEGYGRPLPGAATELRDIRHRHGLILDSVYTHKAFAGLKQLVSDGVIRRGSSVVFVHTGGINERFLER